MSDPTPFTPEPARPKRGGRRKAPESQIRAELDAAEYDPIEPLQYTNAHTGIPCVCRKCGEEVSVIMVVMRRGGGCRSCWERRRGQSQRMTPEQAADKLAAANLKPLEEFTLAEVPILCECLGCGKVASKVIAHLNPGSLGCKGCGLKKGWDGRRTDPREVEAFMLEAGLRPVDIDSCILSGSTDAAVAEGC